MRFPISGADSARSHLETAWRDSPNCSAKPSWEKPRSRRSSARRWAISTFIMVPFRVLRVVTSRLSPYGFPGSCTSTLCGQFQNPAEHCRDNQRLPHMPPGKMPITFSMIPAYHRKAPVFRGTGGAQALREGGGVRLRDSNPFEAAETRSEQQQPVWEGRRSASAQRRPFEPSARHASKTPPRQRPRNSGGGASARRFSR